MPDGDIIIYPSNPPAVPEGDQPDQEQAANDLYVSAPLLFELDGTATQFKTWATNSSLVTEATGLATMKDAASLSRKAAYNAAIVNVMWLRSRQTRLNAIGSEFVRERISLPTETPPEA
jgi:hypothetical protein